MDSGLQKLAAQAIQQLKDENSSLQEELGLIKEAEKLAFLLYKQGSVMAEELENTIDSFAQKTHEELEIIKKASELNKIASSISSFKLSSKYEDDMTLDPLTRCLLEDL